MMTDNDSTKSRNENRFIVINSNGEISIKDTYTGKYPFSIVFEEIDMQEHGIHECLAVSRLLNELHEENTTIKQTLANMIATERTHIGKNVLIQFKEAIQ